MMEQRKQMITIHDLSVECGKRQVAAWCFGNLAIHRSLERDEKLTLTHVPTGMQLFGVSEFVTFDELKEAALDLAPLFEVSPQVNIIKDKQGYPIPEITPEYREWAERLKPQILRWQRKMRGLDDDE